MSYKNIFIELNSLKNIIHFLRIRSISLLHALYTWPCYTLSICKKFSSIISKSSGKSRASKNSCMIVCKLMRKVGVANLLTSKGFTSCSDNSIMYCNSE